jgi:hypothetical protein
MKKLIFVLALILTQSVYARSGDVLLKNTGHVKSKCLSLADARDFDFVDTISLFIYSTKRPYLISVEPCEALDVAWGIGFLRANADNLCGGDTLIVYGENSVVLQYCAITSVTPVKHVHYK